MTLSDGKEMPRRRLQNGASVPGDMEELDVSFSANGLSFELKLQRNKALIDASAKHMLVRGG